MMKFGGFGGHTLWIWRYRERGCVKYEMYRCVKRDENWWSWCKSLNEWM